MGSCQGKAATFGNNAKFAVPWDPKDNKNKKKNPKGNNSTATATASASPSFNEASKIKPEQLENMGFFSFPNSSRDTSQFEYGFINQATVTAGNDDSDVSSSEDYGECEDSEDHTCGDKWTCPVCKKATFDVDDITDHLLEIHDVDIQDPNHTVKEAKIAWNKGIRINKYGAQSSDKSDNQGYNSPAQFLSSDSYERAKKSSGKFYPSDGSVKPSQNNKS